MIRRASLVAVLAVAALGLPAEARPFALIAQCFNAAGAGGTPSMSVAGQATATSVAETRVPLYVEITCTVSNVPFGGTDTLTSSTGLPGAVVATANADTSWDITLPVRLCTRARAIFGPISPFEFTTSICF